MCACTETVSVHSQYIFYTCMHAQGETGMCCACTHIESLFSYTFYLILLSDNQINKIKSILKTFGTYMHAHTERTKNVTKKVTILSDTRYLILVL